MVGDVTRGIVLGVFKMLGLRDAEMLLLLLFLADGIQVLIDFHAFS